MSEKQRNRSRIFIEKYAIDYNVQYSDHEEIDKLVYPKEHFQ